MSKKKPDRDIHQLKERIKIESEVFDTYTLIILSKLIKKGIIETVDYPISTGKEANVFRATKGDKFVVVKIYKHETSPFARKEMYLEGDPRFEKIKPTEKEIVKAFARKEFKNLELCNRAGIHCPQPLFLIEHVLVMEFLGEDGLPYPTINLSGPIHGEKDLDSILNDMKKMYEAGLVHADLSEYNILEGRKNPYLIDFGQGVLLRHPNAEKFLERDIINVLRYFEKCGFKRDYKKISDWIRASNKNKS